MKHKTLLLISLFLVITTIYYLKYSKQPHFDNPISPDNKSKPVTCINKTYGFKFDLSENKTDKNCPNNDNTITADNKVYEIISVTTEDTKDLKLWWNKEVKVENDDNFKLHTDINDYELVSGDNIAATSNFSVLNSPLDVLTVSIKIDKIIIPEEVGIPYLVQYYAYDFGKPFVIKRSGIADGAGPDTDYLATFSTLRPIDK